MLAAFQLLNNWRVGSRWLLAHYAQAERPAHHDFGTWVAFGVGAFDALYEPIVRRKTSLLDEFSDPRAKIVEGIHHAVHLEFERRFAAEQSFAQYALDRLICRMVVVEGVTHDADELPARACAQADAAVMRRGAEINQDTAGFEHPVRF